MPIKKIFWTMLMTGVIVTCTPVTRAQSTAAELERASQEEQAVAQGGILDILERQKTAIVGTWLGTAGNGNKILITFNEGGTVLLSLHGINVTNNTVLTPTHGVWKHLGGRQFGVTGLAVRYNPITTNTMPPVPAGSLLSYLKLQNLLTISEDGDELTGMSIVRALDPDGNVVGNPTIINNVPPFTRIKLEPFN